MTVASDELVGLDRLARAFARQLSRMPPASMVAIHGAPGSAKADFLHLLAGLIRDPRALELEPGLDLYPEMVWIDAWSYAKQGNVIAGVVSRVAKLGPSGASVQERARDVIGQLNRLHLDDRMPTTPGPAFAEGEMEPVDRLQQGFAALVQTIRSSHAGRVVICVEGLDRVRPEVRWQTLDGLRLLVGDGAEVTVLVSIGGQAAAMAARYAEGDLNGASIDQVLSDMFALSLTVPSLEVRRIGSILRRHLGDGDGRLTDAFGPAAVTGLAAAVAHRPLGSPRFVFRLVQRVLLLAEYTIESQTMRELSEAQWCWVIVSERWPAFRRFMIRGGRRRWAALRQAMGALGAGTSYGPGEVGGEIGERLAGDPILADYLKLHADGFEQDIDGIFWLENQLLASGL